MLVEGGGPDPSGAGGGFAFGSRRLNLDCFTSPFALPLLSARVLRCFIHFCADDDDEGEAPVVAPLDSRRKQPDERREESKIVFDAVVTEEDIFFGAFFTCGSLFFYYCVSGENSDDFQLLKAKLLYISLANNIHSLSINQINHRARYRSTYTPLSTARFSTPCSSESSLSARHPPRISSTNLRTSRCTLSSSLSRFARRR